MCESQFLALLDGKETLGRLDRDWAAIRLLDYKPYADIVRYLGFQNLVAGWPRCRDHIRSTNPRRAFDFLVDWLPKHYPDMVK